MTEPNVYIFTGPLHYDPFLGLPQVGLLKNLVSPNIVKLHTCFLDQNVVWVVMEWVDGGDLKGDFSR